MATPEEMEASMIQNLEEKTGQTLDQWMKIVRARGLSKHGEMVKLLKDEHGMGHGYANLVAHKAREQAAPATTPGPAAGGFTGDDLIDAQYAGKEDLRPIYEALIAKIRAFGDDVEIAPKKTYVSLRRSKQFGLIQPSTKTRVDVGIQLKGREAGERLEASGSFNAMVSHRVRVTAEDQVDDELIGWLRDAYETA